MFLVTGGAGFIGSNVVASLNEAGSTDVVVNDLLGADDAKWRNLAKRQVADLVPPAELAKWLDGRKLDAVIHMGAISDTTATDGDLVMENNFRLSLRLLDWCTATRTPFIYASSAATYGDGTQGFTDDWSLPALRELKPMNLYGWSKHLFDLALVDRFVKKEKLPPRWVGLKFFNVYGPNEYHKGHMASVFNVGTGKAESFRDMIGAMFKALGRAPNIEYIDMPDSIRGQYQYFTQSSVENLRRAGYNAGFTPLERAVGQYVTGYLDRDDRYR